MDEVEGLIGYFELSEWWLSTFDETEREQIEERYSSVEKVVGADEEGRQLTEGKVASTSQSASELLRELAEGFDNVRDIDIRDRLLEKAQEIEHLDQ